MRSSFPPAMIGFATAFGLIVATGTVLMACTDSVPDTRPVAVWDDGRLEQSDYLAWIDHQNLEPSLESVRNLVLIMSLAEDARQRGMEERVEVVLAAEAMRHAKILPALKQHIDAQISISEDEIEQLLATYPNAFQQPRKLFLRGIYRRLPTEKQGREAVRHQMRALRAEVVDGADIKQLARLESESQSRFRDGSIGFVDPARLPPPVGKAVEGMAIGDVSGLIEHADGLAFYVCEGIKPEIVPDADQVRRKFRQNLYRQRSAELNKALVEQLVPRIRIRLAEDPVLKVGDLELPADWLDALSRLRHPDRDPASLDDRQKRRLLQDWGRRVAMSDHAESLGLGQPDAMRWFRMHALATAELRFQVDSLLSPPSESELLGLYDQRKERLLNPAGYRVAVIQFASADDLKRPEVVGQARDALTRIRDGRLSFGQAARELSIHASARNGGALGWRTPRELGGLDLGVVRPVRALSPGQDTGLLRLHSGLWMLKLLEQRPASIMTFEQARGQLEQALRKERIRRLETEVREQHLAEIALRILEASPE